MRYKSNKRKYNSSKDHKDIFEISEKDFNKIIIRKRKTFIDLTEEKENDISYPNNIIEIIIEKNKNNEVEIQIYEDDFIRNDITEHIYNFELDVYTNFIQPFDNYALIRRNKTTEIIKEKLENINKEYKPQYF